MLSHHTVQPSSKNTAAILNRLQQDQKTTKNLFSKLNSKTLGVLAFLALLPKVEAYRELVTHLVSQDTNYRIITDGESTVFNEAIRLLKEKLPLHVKNVPLEWDLIKDWSPSSFVNLFRGAEQTVQPEVEAMLISALDASDKELHRLENNDFKSVLIILGAIIGFFIFLFLMAKVFQCRLTRQPMPAPLAAVEAGNVKEKQKPPVSEVNLQPINPYMKQLEDAGIDTSVIEEHPKLARFIDVVTRELIQYPVLTDDGNIYEKQTLKNCLSKGNGKCPKNPAIKIKQMLPMNDFKAEMVNTIEDVIRRSKQTRGLFTSSPMVIKKNASESPRLLHSI